MAVSSESGDEVCVFVLILITRWFRNAYPLNYVNVVASYQAKYWFVNNIYKLYNVTFEFGSYVYKMFRCKKNNKCSQPGSNRRD